MEGVSNAVCADPVAAEAHAEAAEDSVRGAGEPPVPSHATPPETGTAPAAPSGGDCTADTRGVPLQQPEQWAAQPQALGAPLSAAWIPAPLIPVPAVLPSYPELTMKLLNCQAQLLQANRAWQQSQASLEGEASKLRDCAAQLQEARKRGWELEQHLRQQHAAAESIPAELAARTAELAQARLLQQQQEAELLALRNIITTNAMSASASAARIGELADGAVKRLKGWLAATHEPFSCSAGPGGARGGGSGAMVLSVVDAVVLEQLENCGVDIACLRTAAQEAADSADVGAGAAAQAVRRVIAAWLAVLLAARSPHARKRMRPDRRGGCSAGAGGPGGRCGGGNSARPAELPSGRRVGR